jgi:hypothetical protein
MFIQLRLLLIKISLLFVPLSKACYGYGRLPRNIWDISEYTDKAVIDRSQQVKYFQEQKIQPLNSTPFATLIQEGCVGRHISVFICTHKH